MSAQPVPRPSSADLLGAVLANRPGALDRLGACDVAWVRAEAEYHGVLPLLAEHLRGEGWDKAALVTALDRDLVRHVAADLAVEAELRHVVQTLDEQGIVPLLLKGAHLAYTHYPRPDLRPRTDTDVLIMAAARPAADRVLQAIGYVPQIQAGGDFVSYESMYQKSLGHGVTHTVDLHWRIANPHLFAQVLSYDEAMAHAVPIPKLNPSARGLAAPYALLLAAVHRAAHHFGDECLIWLYDMHLLASALHEEEWSEFAVLAEDRGVASICERGLDRMAEHFDTALPAPVQERLARAATRRADRATAAYLDSGRRQFDNFINDFRALPAWRSRWRLVVEHLFPSREYMRDVYAPASRVPLSLLYLRRAMKGGRRWFARSIRDGQPD